ncbi:MAG TPA: YeeE/YedE thiosulfate transporter family protein [Gemmatimonadaceae bacterium]|nr:YeeE/YedE thiosulfate transporter family protein [Gemmatimonadaceae bacterium]
MIELLSRPWPWYVSGPLIGLMVPLLLLLGNKQFGVSSNLRHLCAAIAPGGCDYFDYDWRRTGVWNLVFAAGILLGGVIASTLLGGGDQVGISAQTQADLSALGLRDVTGFMPGDLFTWRALLTLPGFVAVVIGGYLVGFGTAYAGGCTSGHAIAGLADLQLPSLIAVIGFLAGGLVATWLLLPLLL